MLLAMFVRVVSSFLIGPGTFGPDGAGAEAAAHLGGHPNVLHPILVEFFGGGRGLSAFSGAVTAVACAKMGQRLGGRILVCGFLGACAPLLVVPSSMAGGDAPAIALASSGLALALWNKPFAGALIAGLSLGVKPIALPLLLLLPAGVLFTEDKRRFALRLALGMALPVWLFLSALDPMLHPRPNSGILGSWWLATEGAFPSLAQWPGLGWAGFKALWTLPTWTGHPLLGALALFACIRAKNRQLWVLFGLSATALLLTAAVFGESLRVRYLGGASVGMTVLAGVGLSRAGWVPFLFLWPTFAFASQLGALRSTEEGGGPRPELTWLRPIDVEPSFEEGGICGGDELRDMAKGLIEHLPEGAEVAAIHLRDGRESELFWKLRVARSDLRPVSLGAHCCPDGDLMGCATRIRSHLYRSGGALVIPHTPPNCKTHLASPRDLELAKAFGLEAQAQERFSLLSWGGTGEANSGIDSCGAARPASW
jgi:hypothetical protein